VVELVVNYWDKAGIKTVVKMVDKTFYHEIKYSNQLQIGVADGSMNVFVLAYRPDALVPLRVLTEWYGHYGLWRQSMGEKGVKPTGDVMLLLDYWDKLVASTKKEDIDKWADKIVELHEKNVWVIGVAGVSPQFIVAHNRLRNVREGLYYCDELRYYGVANPATWYMKN
jgi:peptide/nickel transport system substrate-binding protein